MKRLRKPAAFACLILVILVLNHRFGWSQYLRDPDNLAFLGQLVQQNLLQASLLYIGITIIACVVLAVPGVTFAVLAGVLFGPWLGTLLCLGATTAGAAAAFLAGRFFLQDAIRPLVMKNPLLKRLLFDEKGRSDMIVLMITRLVPLFPYNLQNFAYGITDMKVIPYTIYTFIFMLPGVAFFTVASAGLTAREGRGTYLALAAGLLVLVLFLGWFLRKRFLSDTKEKENL